MALRFIAAPAIVLACCGAFIPMPATFAPPPILMYHRVDVDRPADATGRQLTLSPQRFAQQLKYLKEHGLQGISLARMWERLRRRQGLDRTVVLTFDDGYRDQYTYALPLLREYHDTATFFIVTGDVGDPRHLTWKQLAAMRDAGQDICAHGVQHDDLSRMSPSRQAYQIETSVWILRTRLGVPALTYAYPSGRLNRATLQLVRDAGLSLAVTTDPVYVIQPETRLELPRLRVRGDWTVRSFSQALRTYNSHRFLY
jgi:peptidoglycan/xylan/chitin deacetylase (PgdA/CDA1 family)